MQCHYALLCSQCVLGLKQLELLLGGPKKSQNNMLSERLCRPLLGCGWYIGCGERPCACARIARLVQSVLLSVVCVVGSLQMFAQLRWLHEIRACFEAVCLLTPGVIKVDVVENKKRIGQWHCDDQAWSGAEFELRWC